MGSVQDYLRCSICGGVVFSDFDYKRMEDFISCQGCGRHFSNQNVAEEKPREDGRTYYEHDPEGLIICVINNIGPMGSYSFVLEQGGGQSGPIQAGTTLENWPQEFPFDLDGRLLNKNNEPIALDMTRSHISFYDEATGEFNTVWGNRPDDTLGDETEEFLSEAELYDWSRLDDIPKGVFLSENATPDVVVRLGLPVMPPKE